MKLSILTVWLLLALATSVISQPLHVGYQSVDAKGMGGNFIAYPRDATVTMTNPALLNRAGFHLTLLSMPLALDTDLLPVIGFVDEHQEDFARFDSLSADEQDAFLKDMEPFDDSWVSFGLGPYAGITIPWVNLGVAVYSEAVTSIKLDQGVFVPAIGIRGYADAGVALGMGRKIYGQEIGAAVRIYQRRIVAPERISAGDVSNLNDLLTGVSDKLESPQAGFGVDVGYIRTINHNLDVAATVQDLVATRSEETEKLQPNLTTGLAWRPILNDESPVLKRWVVCADFNDLLNSEGVNFWQKINFGSELRLPLLIDLRAGVHQGYPVFGVGLKLLLVRLNYAYYTREGGVAPGQDPEGSHVMGLTIGW